MNIGTTSFQYNCETNDRNVALSKMSQQNIGRNVSAKKTETRKCC